MGTPLDPFTAGKALDLLEIMIVHQRKKVLELAQRIRPGLTEEDIRNVHDFPDVYADPFYQFEDGQLSGLISAKIALKAELVGGTLRT
jgi:hypothetical protein